MILSEMQSLLRFYVDDAVEGAISVMLLNAGQNRMAQEVDASFPQLAGNPDDTFVFDAKYHEMPIIYAAAMFKGYDSSVREKESLMNQFLGMLPNFSENYTILPSQRVGYNVQQFVATAGQITFTITKEGFDPATSFLRVYVNDQPVPYTGTFTIAPCAFGDHVTAIWDTYVEILHPPFTWWEGLP